MRLVLRIVFFLLFVGALAAADAYYINGPLLQQNTEMSMKQFSGAPATVGDFQIGGYWLSFNGVYIVQTILIALVGWLLFAPRLLNLIFAKKP